jgi:hypothetical protein
VRIRFEGGELEDVTPAMPPYPTFGLRISGQVHWFDAGHGSLSVEQNIDFAELMLRFAYRLLSAQNSYSQL